MNHIYGVNKYTYAQYCTETDIFLKTTRAGSGSGFGGEISGSGSGKKVRFRPDPDPDPQHCLAVKVFQTLGYCWLFLSENSRFLMVENSFWPARGYIGLLHVPVSELFFSLPGLWRQSGFFQTCQDISGSWQRSLSIVGILKKRLHPNHITLSGLRHKTRFAYSLSLILFVKGRCSTEYCPWMLVTLIARIVKVIVWHVDSQARCLSSVPRWQTRPCNLTAVICIES